MSPEKATALLAYGIMKLKVRIADNSERFQLSRGMLTGPEPASMDKYSFVSTLALAGAYLSEFNFDRLETRFEAGNPSQIVCIAHRKEYALCSLRILCHDE